MNSPNLVFYDTETTGTNIEFDQIIQFSAILTDQRFKEIDRLNIKCKRLPWVIPSPQAMIVTGVSPSQMDDPNLIQFPEMISIVWKKLQSWSPAIFIGYNSFRFDEPLLQRAFWLTLQPPYLTVTNRNSRADMLPLVRAVSRLVPHVLAIPNMASGHPSYRLDRLAPQNGFAHANAHDALGDVEALIHIAKKISLKSPKLWSSMCKCADRNYISKTLNSAAPVFFAEPSKSGRPGWWGVSVGSDSNSKTTRKVARLDSDWRGSFSEEKSFEKELSETSKFNIRYIKENMAPIMFSQVDAMELFGLTPSKNEINMANFLKHSGRTEALERISINYNEINTESKALEQRIFEGFSSKNDEQVMAEFASLPWSMRVPLIHKFDDARLQQIAQRLIFLMAPDALPKPHRERVESGIRERLLATHTDKNLWRTIYLARDELDELRRSPFNGQALSEIEEWLAGIEKSLQ